MKITVKGETVQVTEAEAREIASQIQAQLDSRRKTAREWFTLLPPDCEERATRNTSVQGLGELHPSFASALSRAFVWRSSPEGREFWEDIINKF